MINKSFTAIVTLCLLCLQGAMAQSVTFCYADHATHDWGTKTKEHYDVAIRIDHPNFMGNHITEIAVPVKNVSGITGYRMWIAKSLTLANINGVKQCPGDVSFDNLTPGDDGWLRVTLPESWTIGEDGVYVGYSFDVNELTDETGSPVLGAGGYKDDNAFYLHTTRRYLAWKAYAKDLGFSSAITVTMMNKSTNNSVGFIGINNSYVAAGKQGSVRALISNMGENPVSSIDVSSTVGVETLTKHIDFAQPLPSDYTLEHEIEIPLPLLASKGDYEARLKIEKVNDAKNANLVSEGTAPVKVLSFVPRHRAILEEYTGLWCGYCPRGFAAIEHMNNAYPGDFIALSYHDGDDMQVLDPKNEWPCQVKGLPAAWMDRDADINAYSGYERDGIFGVDKVWLEYCRELAAASIDATAEWTDADKNRVVVNTTLRLALKTEGQRFRLAYAMTADGLSDPEWYQANYFSGASTTYYWQIPEMKKFTDGDKYIAGLQYDDVVVLAPDIKGIAGSVPDMEEEATATHRYFFDLAGAVNAEGVNVIQNKDRLHVVAILLDEQTGQIVNAVKVPVSGVSTGISDATAESRTAVVCTEYFNLSGSRVAVPHGGAFIRKDIYDNGQCKTSKIIIR